MRPRFANSLRPKKEGAGKTGCTLHPRSRVQAAHKKTHTSIQVQRRQSGLPCAMVLRLISRSPRRPAFLPPSLANDSANLTPASGHQDHTTSPYAIASLVRAQKKARDDAAASTASHPNVVTMANAPLPGRDTHQKLLICRRRKANFFARGLKTCCTTGQISGAPRWLAMQ
jgi:hypothetical protein